MSRERSVAFSRRTPRGAKMMRKRSDVTSSTRVLEVVVADSTEDCLLGLTPDGDVLRSEDRCCRANEISEL